MTLQVEAVEQKPNLLTDRTSIATIDIELTDANDNSPIFQPTNLYSFAVEALAGAGTVIGQVSNFSKMDSSFFFLEFYAR